MTLRGTVALSIALTGSALLAGCAYYPTPASYAYYPPGCIPGAPPPAAATPPAEAPGATPPSAPNAPAQPAPSASGCRLVPIYAYPYYPYYSYYPYGYAYPGYYGYPGYYAYPPVSVGIGARFRL
jgi:hypothetical protein